MPPFKPTAQQYNDCWKERLEKEQKANAQAVAARVAAQAAVAEGQRDDDVISNMSKISTGSRRSSANVPAQDSESVLSGGFSVISSKVSSSSAANRKLEMLQQQLESERKKRREVEQALKAANSSN